MTNRKTGKLYRAWDDSKIQIATLREQSIHCPPSNRAEHEITMDQLHEDSKREKEIFYVLCEGRTYIIWDKTEVPPEYIFELRDDPELSVPVTFEAVGKKKPQAVNLKF